MLRLSIFVFIIHYNIYFPYVFCIAFPRAFNIKYFLCNCFNLLLFLLQFIYFNNKCLLLEPLKSDKRAGFENRTALTEIPTRTEMWMNRKKNYYFQYFFFVIFNNREENVKHISVYRVHVRETFTHEREISRRSGFCRCICDYIERSIKQHKKYNALIHCNSFLCCLTCCLLFFFSCCVRTSVRKLCEKTIEYIKYNT